MKLGILVHVPTTNLGDDIQSLACENLIKSRKADYYIDRENADVFNPSDDVAVVMAAWWMWRKFDWPPSNKIAPFFVGFHYQSFKELNYWNQVGDEKYISDGIGREYLEKYAPVGCRDLSTMNLLQKYNIPCYFSGCITLTLDGYENLILKRERYVVCNDISDSAVERVKKDLEGTGITVKTVTHNLRMSKGFNWEERRHHAEEVLELYKNAICVITFRLHATLPCLALGTPVLLVRKSLDNSRFTPYSEWIHWTTEKDFIDGKYDYSFADPPPNSKLYLPYREKLIHDVTSFYSNAVCNADCIQPFRIYRSEDEIAGWRVRKMRETCEEYRNAYQKAVHDAKVARKQ